MMRCQKLEHRFVQFVPEKLEPGVLYLSLEFCTASHACCCCCGQEVVTPLSPVQWRMTFDGETVSLWPSIGNWSLRCRSHYVIDHGCVLAAPPWSDTQVEAGRQHDRDARAQHYGTLPNALPRLKVTQTPQAPSAPPKAKKYRFWTRLWKWIFRS